jgi:hypothetical protein
LLWATSALVTHPCGAHPCTQFSEDFTANQENVNLVMFAQRSRLPVRAECAATSHISMHGRESSIQSAWQILSFVSFLASRQKLLTKEDYKNKIRSNVNKMYDSPNSKRTRSPDPVEVHAWEGPERTLLQHCMRSRDLLGLQRAPEALHV